MTRARILADYVAGGTTAAEFDHMDGVTSNVQTQLNAKAPLASPAFTGTPTGITAAHLEAGVLPSDVTGGSGLTALGTVASGTWNGSIIGSAYGGNLVKTGSQTWNGSENDKYLNNCFSATYKSYLVSGAFWNPATNGHALRMKMCNLANNEISNGYEYGFRGVNMDGTEGTRNGSGASHILLDAGFSNGSEKTIAFQFIVKGTHDTDMETSFVGQILEETYFLSGGAFNTAGSTNMVGLFFERESASNIEGWVNVYGIQE